VTVSETSGAGCPECSAAVDHCHGTLVLHADGSVECTDPSCTVYAVDRHGLLLVCGAAEGCSCDSAESER
jgi:hypothetical protein